MTTTDTTVWCKSCLREQHVSFSRCLSTGWPKCCGETMRLKESPTAEFIDAAVGDSIRDQVDQQLATQLAEHFDSERGRLGE